MNCKILNLTYLNTKTLSVILEAEGDFDFLAGQYVVVELGESEKLPFSIASSPEGNRKFELHLGGISKDSTLAKSAVYLQQCFQNKESVIVESAKGHAWLRPADGKIVLVAGGSGYTYTRSLLKEVLKRNPESDILSIGGAIVRLIFMSMVILLN